MTSGAFYVSTPASNFSIGSTASYTQAGPLYFEAPGTDSGDWALGCALSATGLITRSDFGVADPTRNFLQFDGGASNFVFMTSSTSGGSGHTYSFNYRVFQFEQL